MDRIIKLLWLAFSHPVIDAMVAMWRYGYVFLLLILYILRPILAIAVTLRVCFRHTDNHANMNMPNIKKLGCFIHKIEKFTLFLCLKNRNLNLRLLCIALPHPLMSVLRTKAVY